MISFLRFPIFFITLLALKPSLTTSNVFATTTNEKSNNDDLTELQQFLDDKVKNSKNIIGLSTFLVAGSDSSSNDSISTLTAGKAVLSSAWDLTTKSGVSAKSTDVTSETTFMIASVSKLITWTALNMMMDAGKFSIDDAVKDHLPWSFQNLRFPNVDVTYRHLYSHTSGILDNYDDYFYGDQCPADEPYPQPLQKMVKTNTSLKKYWSNKKPGSKYEYSNYATALAAVLVEQHSGISFTEFTEKYIFQPLQMSSTTWPRPTDGTAAELYEKSKKQKYDYQTYYGGYCFPDWPSGQLWTTAGDLAKFAKVMLRRGALGYETADGADCLYSQETGEKVYEKTSPTTGEGDSAYGWFVSNNEAGHDGSETGVNTELSIHLNKNVGVGYLANGGDLSYNEISSIMNRLKSTAESIGPIDISSSATSCTSTWSVVDPTPPVSSPVQSPTTVTEPSDCSGSGGCPESTGKLEVEMLTDAFGDVDNFWYVKKGKKKVLNINSLSNSTAYEWCSCLPTGKYKYFIRDREGDGFAKPGYLKMRWNGKQKLNLNAAKGKWSKKKKNLKAK